MIQQLDADALLAGELGQWLAQQGSAREEAKRKARFRFWIVVVPGVALALLILIGSGNFQVPAFLGFGAFSLGGWWSHKAKAPLLRAIKSRMNTKIAGALQLNYSCDCNPGEEFQRAKTFELLPGYDREGFEDLWWGEVGAIPFSIYEAHLRQWQGSGKNRRLVTVFRGSVMTVAFQRRFHGTTLIERNGARLTFWGLRDSITAGGVKLDRVSMVDTRFAEDFVVWGSDQVEAHYLVHPEYVERLIAIEQAFHGQKLRALFKDGQLLILMDSGDMFESGSLDASQDRALLAQTIQQFSSLANLATRLNEAPRGNFT